MLIFLCVCVLLLHKKEAFHYEEPNRGCKRGMQIPDAK